MTDKLAKRDEVLFPAKIEDVMKLANTLVKSGFCPSGVTTGAQALAIIMRGRELGIPPMSSLCNLYTVKGKVALTANMMAAKILQYGHRYKVIERDDKKCVIDFYRKENPNEVVRGTYTWEMAQKAQLTGKDNYKKHPIEMMFSGCMRTWARIVYADLFAGFYTPEELGAIVNEEGEIESVPEESIDTIEGEIAVVTPNASGNFGDGVNTDITSIPSKPTADEKAEIAKMQRDNPPPDAEPESLYITFEGYVGKTTFGKSKKGKDYFSFGVAVPVDPNQPGAATEWINFPEWSETKAKLLAGYVLTGAKVKVLCTEKKEWQGKKQYKLESVEVLSPPKQKQSDPSTAPDPDPDLEFGNDNDDDDIFL